MIASRHRVAPPALAAAAGGAGDGGVGGLDLLEDVYQVEVAVLVPPQKARLVAPQAVYQTS